MLMGDPVERPVDITSTSHETKAARLTARQRQIYEFVVHYIASHAYPPTLREIGAAHHIRSTNGVNDHLRALERKGLLRRSSMKARGIIIVDCERLPDPEIVQTDVAMESWRAENVALREILRRVETAARRLPTLSAELVVVLGDVRDVLRAGGSS